MRETGRGGGRQAGGGQHCMLYMVIDTDAQVVILISSGLSSTLWVQLSQKLTCVKLH